MTTTHTASAPAPALFDLYTFRDGVRALEAAGIALEVAADLAGLDASEIAWAVEEEGRADVDADPSGSFTVVAAGDPAPEALEG